MNSNSNLLLPDRELRERLINLANRERKKLPEKPSRSDIEQIFDVAIIETQLSEDQDGAYDPGSKKIIINSYVTSNERKQFTLFHELTHHLLRQDDDLYAYLHETYRDNNGFIRALEFLCNIGAAEFILPREKVREVIKNNQFSLNLIPDLCKFPLVSGPAALFQLIQNASHECYAIVCEVGLPPSKEKSFQDAFINRTNKSSLFIQYAIWSPIARYSVARFTIIPKNHILHNGLNSIDLIKGKDRIPFRSGKGWPVTCEVLYFRGSVYGLFNVGEPINHQQMRLF
ncbi:ImmA/IrrE family metallo-endopeptidase [bacterium]|nr:ImmA/IrrE family metallo-endopeptidase [bacterium]